MVGNDDRDQFAARHVSVEFTHALAVPDHLVEAILEFSIKCLGLARDRSVLEIDIRMISNMFSRSVTPSCAW